MTNTTNISRVKVPVSIEKLSDGDDSVIRFVASTNNIDRDGDIIDQKGWDVSHFMQNPVILANHENRIEKIVGKATRVEVQDDQMIIDVKFAKDESELANLAWRLYKNGFASAVSVGFMPDFDSIKSKEIGGKTVMVIGKAELLELSMVAVQSNREALVVRSEDAFSKKEASMIKNTWGLDLGVDTSKEDKELFKRKMSAVADNHEAQKMLMKHFAKINKMIGYHPIGDFAEDIPESYKMLQECLSGGYGKSLTPAGGGCGCGRSAGGCCGKSSGGCCGKSVCDSETQSRAQDDTETQERPSDVEGQKYLESLLSKIPG